MIDEELLKKYVKAEYRDHIRSIIEDIDSLGYKIIHKYPDGFPMIIGGTDFYARKGKLFMIYSTKGYLTLQYNEDNMPDWDGQFICKNYPALNLKIAYRQIT
jgi:hypothetical protein